MQVKILPLALAVLLAGPAIAADFVALAQKAHADSAPPNRDALNELWAALFKLPQWHFLMTPKSAAQKQPSVQEFGGEGWLLVFTDSEKLKHYAKTNKNLAADGSALFISMTPDAARKFIAGSAVAGVRFNEGATQGWFAPVKNIDGIYEYLKKNGKL